MKATVTITSRRNQEQRPEVFSGASQRFRERIPQPGSSSITPAVKLGSVGLEEVDCAGLEGA